MADTVTARKNLPDWLELKEGITPLLLSLPHTGTEIPAAMEDALVSPWLARKDTDWWVEQLYAFATDLGASVIRTRISRTVIDVNRDPSGASLYPGQATTGLCPVETFDGEALYRTGCEPDAEEISSLIDSYFNPYHQAISDQIARLRQQHQCVILYDAHSIRSEIPRLFDGILPHINIGTNSGTSCCNKVEQSVADNFAETPFTLVRNGRFKGGWITRHYGQPNNGVHAIQIELAMRSYLAEHPGTVLEGSWPPPYEPGHAEPLRNILQKTLADLGDWAAQDGRSWNEPHRTQIDATG